MVYPPSCTLKPPYGFLYPFYLIIGMVFSCIGIVYYVSLKDMPRVTRGVPQPAEKPVIINRINSSLTLDPFTPKYPYDLTTYGLKLFKCSNKDPMASSKYSTVHFSYETGNTYVVLVNLYDSDNSRRTTGGDVIVMWAEQHGGDGRVSGSVTDNLNGSYTGSFKIFWTGQTVIKVKIASTIQNQCLRSNALFRYGNTVYAKPVGWGIHAVYKRDDEHHKTKCGANPFIYLSTSLCNFTKLNANIPWYCEAPPINSSCYCSDIDHFTIEAFATCHIPADEKMVDFGHGILKKKSYISIKKKWGVDKSLKCCNYPNKYTWTNTKPSGYWAGGRWNFIHCDNIGLRLSNESYRKCLRGKYLAFIGDSTIRHMMEYFLGNVLNLRHAHVYDGLGQDADHKTIYHNHKEFTAFGITATYLKHEFPFHNINFPPNNITSVPQELLKLESKNISGNDLIVLLHYNVHLQAYPIEQFHLRIRRLVPTVRNLLNSKPGTRILIRGPHMTIDDTRWFDPRISLIYMDILHKEFWEIRDHVTYLDTWSITVAHNSENFHPQGKAFVSQIHQMMSYICPDQNL